MRTGQSLESYLNDWAADDPSRVAVADTLNAVAQASTTVADLIGRGPLAGSLAEEVGDNAGGDAQKFLDVRADELFIEAFQAAPVAIVYSEERDDPVPLDAGAPLAVAIDPLDGSSNIDTNVSIGTIVSVFPAPEGTDAPLPKGRDQVAAAFTIYGPQTSIVFTLGAGTHSATLDRASGRFIVTAETMQIPTGRREYAINASNYRFWDPAVQAYIDDCIAGAEGPRGENFNMRWIASLVAEAYRVLQRGGIFLYPRDARPGYQEGRLRLVYEANPIAFIVEQAGGAATDGIDRILTIAPKTMHQRTPLVFGSRDKVELVGRYHTEPPATGEFSPLFGRRGLFRA